MVSKGQLLALRQTKISGPYISVVAMFSWAVFARDSSRIVSARPSDSSTRAFNQLTTMHGLIMVLVLYARFCRISELVGADDDWRSRHGYQG